MKPKGTFLCIFLLLSFIINISEAQSNKDDSWKLMFHIQGGIFGKGGASSYAYFEEYYFCPDALGREGSTELKYNISFLITGGFEISKRYMGFQGNFGVTPARMDMLLKNPVRGDEGEEIEKYSITTFYAEGTFLFFPMGNGADKIAPYLAIGAGGCKFKGQRNNGGYLLSYGGGVRISFKKKYGLVIGFKGFYIDFGETQEIYGPGVNLKLTPLQATCGFIYRFN